MLKEPKSAQEAGWPAAMHSDAELRELARAGSGTVGCGSRFLCCLSHSLCF